MLPHIVPYNKENVAKDQPWLASAGSDYMDVFEQITVDRLSHSEEGVDGCVIPDLIARAEEGDQYAFQKVYPFPHFILTEDYRIVEEPNFLRWGLFLELAKHRQIDKTCVCEGPIRPDSSESSHSIGPSFKTEETAVSTVFIGTAENELFETMIFGGPLCSMHWRYQTLLDAKKGHWKAVELAHKANRYMKRHGKSFRKDWIRLDKMHRLIKSRGFNWLQKHLSVFESLHKRLYRAPGPPSIPQPSIMYSIAEMFLPSEPL